MNEVVEQIKNAPHEQIPELAKDKFIQVYSQKFGQDQAEAFYEEQKNFFLGELATGSYAPKLKVADNMSLYFAFMSIAINGLSLEKGTTTTCYLEAKSVKIGEDPNRLDANHRPTPIYQTNATISITGYGEIVLRQRAGQIKSVDTPKVVYDCDDFSFGEENGKPTLTWKKCIPRPKGSRLIACYVRIVKNDGTFDYKVLDTDEILRLKNYSLRQNYGKFANPLYGTQPDCSDIDTGFLMSKTVKHAFKGYPKLPLGAGSTLEADKDSEPIEPIAAPQAPFPPTNGVTIKTNEDDPFNQ